jgi:hypothetical protein
MAMTRPPPTPVEPAPPAACTTSRLAPVLDTAGAVLVGVPGVVTTAYGIATPVCTTGWCLLEPTTPGNKAAIISVGLVLVGISVMQTVSAVNGLAGATTRLPERGGDFLRDPAGSPSAARKVPGRALRHGR